MRGHDRSAIRRRRLDGVWLLLIALPLAGSVAGWAVTTHGQEAVDATWKGDEGEPIRLRADRLQTWTEGSSEWAILEDQVEIRQGAVSLRADRGVARIVRAGRADGSILRVDLYVEGQVRDPANPGSSWGEVRTRLVTKGQVGREARVPGGRLALSRAPRGLPILAHAFPESSTDRPAGPVETSSSGPAPLPVPEPAPTIEVAPAVGSAAAPFGSVPLSLPKPEATTARLDPAVRPAQVPAMPAFPDDFTARPMPEPPPAPAADQPPLAPNSVPLGPSFEPPVVDNPPTNLQPLPDAAPGLPRGNGNSGMAPAPVLVGSQRITTIYPRGLGKIELESYPVQKDGTQILVIRNGVNIQTRSKEQGIVDIEADSVVIWRRDEGKLGPPSGRRQ